MSATASWRPISRRFPNLGWAWPSGSHDQLIKAALVPDDRAALASALTWLDAHDIDRSTFQDHRLLAALSDRFGDTLAGHAAAPRLAGLERHRWARAQLALRTVAPIFAALEARNLRFMWIAAALPGIETQALMVSPSDTAGTLNVLIECGWRTTDDLELLTRHHHEAVRFIADRAGEVYLTTQAYHVSHRADRDEADLWARAQRHTYQGSTILAPSAVDAAALAIARCQFSPTACGACMLDCATALRQPGFDWDLFARTIHRRALAAPAAIVLGYLAQELGLPIAAEPLAAIRAQAEQDWTQRLAALGDMAPRGTNGALISALQWWARKRRRRHARHRSATASADSCRLPMPA